ncbi:MAG TPA: transcription elongation factor Spt5 [Euryarchaeota archaeon]|nr:transcription elongation factor Spt5 [Euryarchaeota archaeon]HIQ10337.1 transcription elongation factor Spt5 [Euryarchaeota archaeon]
MEEQQKTHIWGIRTTAGQEDVVATLLAERSKRKMAEGEQGLLAIIVPPQVKGYVLVEAADEVTVRRIITGVPHVKGVIGGGSMDVSEIDAMLESKPIMDELKPGTIVKLIAGPFKGAKAKIIRIDPQKEEITVELLETAVKIPITVEAENVRALTEGEA